MSKFKGYDLIYVRGHWEIFKDGKRCGSADTKAEAIKDLEEED